MGTIRPASSGGEEHDVGRGREEPGGRVRNHHAFSQQLVQIAVGLQHARPAPGLQAGLQRPDEAADQRGNRQQQDELDQRLERCFRHPRTPNNNRRISVTKMYAR